MAFRVATLNLKRHEIRERLDWLHEREIGPATIACGDFNAGLDHASIQLMAEKFRTMQQAPTAFTPLRKPDGEPTHIAWNRFDRCIDFIWVSKDIHVLASGLCFDQPAPADPTLWPSDHLGVWADLRT